MDLRSFKLSWIKNKETIKDLESFLENLIHKKGQDIITIVIFGSLARNEAKFTKDYRSDIDLLIISSNLPDNIIERKLYTANLSKSLGCGIDQLWYTPAAIKKAVDSHRAFFFEIIKYGKNLFEVDQFITVLKEKVERILKEKGIKESKYAWIWPQDTPGCEIDW